MARPETAADVLNRRGIRAASGKHLGHSVVASTVQKKMNGDYVVKAEKLSLFNIC
jgi:hypothetical protein